MAKWSLASYVVQQTKEGNRLLLKHFHQPTGHYVPDASNSPQPPPQES